MNRLRRMGKKPGQVSEPDLGGSLEPEAPSEDAGEQFAYLESGAQADANGPETGGEYPEGVGSEPEIPGIDPIQAQAQEPTEGARLPTDDQASPDEFQAVESPDVSAAYDDTLPPDDALPASEEAPIADQAASVEDLVETPDVDEVGVQTAAEMASTYADTSVEAPPQEQPVEAAPQVAGATLVADEQVEGTEEYREPQQPEGTRPLSQVPEREDLSPLPVNAVVASRYVVQNQLHHHTDRNLYRVATRRQQVCPQCGRLSSEEAEVCDQCGSALSGQPPAEFYLMAESYRPEALVQDPDIMQLNLYHPNLVPVIDFFSYKPFGRTRYYAVAEPRQGVRLTQLSMPRPATQVLAWALQLADALAYLHGRGVVGAGAEADDILVQGDRASLASLQNARSTVESDAERQQQQSIDLARLAATMYETYTGQVSTMTPEGVLHVPPVVPEQVRAAFRAAIEPVQGAAPAITTAQWHDLLARALETVYELEQPGRPVDFVSAALTNVGRLRDQNQDSFGKFEFVQASSEHPMNFGLYVVADGMGGHKGGEMASVFAVQAFSGDVLGRIVAPLVLGTGDQSAPTNEAILQGLTRAVQVANDRIYKARDNRQNDMGTTLVAALVVSGKAYIVNVGDSRLYLYAKVQDPSEKAMLDATRPLAQGTSPLPGQLSEPKTDTTDDLQDHSNYALMQVSVDHSLVHRLVELGQLGAEEAKVHPHRNFIYRSVGGPPPVEVDTFVRTLHPGERLLICSDGLNSMVEDSAIEGVLATEQDTGTACRRLVELANDAGGHDNISVILVDIKDYLPAPASEH